MRKRYIFLFLSGWLLSGRVQAQDPQFTQWFAAPQYLNPAFAGSALAPRLTVNYRNQWPAITGGYVTTAAGVDHHISKLNSGVGLLVVNDNQGQGRITSTDVGLQYAYQFQVSESAFVRLGLQGSYVTRRIDYFGLTFGDQFTPSGPTGGPTADPVAQGAGPRNRYLDFSTGGLVYSDWYWAGVAVHHLNRPGQGFLTADGSRLPMKVNVHLGLRIPLAGFTGLGDELNREVSFSPVILYKSQGRFDQLDMGAYLTYSPITVGAYYRGIPFKKYAPSLNNHDALAVLVGYRADQFSIGYSYDATVSTLGFASGGSHEISLSYTFEKPESNRNRYKRRERKLPCPKF